MPVRLNKVEETRMLVFIYHTGVEQLRIMSSDAELCSILCFLNETEGALNNITVISVNVFYRLLSYQQIETLMQTFLKSFK